MTLVQEAMSLMEAMPVKNTQTNRRAAVLDLAGLWKGHENELSAEKTVRAMRKGRSLDTGHRCSDLVSQRESKFGKGIYLTVKRRTSYSNVI